MNRSPANFEAWLERVGYTPTTAILYRRQISSALRSMQEDCTRKDLLARHAANLALTSRATLYLAWSAYSKYMSTFEPSPSNLTCCALPTAAEREQALDALPADAARIAMVTQLAALMQQAPENVGAARFEDYVHLSKSNFDLHVLRIPVRVKKAISAINIGLNPEALALFNKMKAQYPDGTPPPGTQLCPLPRTFFRQPAAV